jgi:hypothetical protein
MTTKRLNPSVTFQKVVGSLTGLLSAVTAAAVAGHSIGWWQRPLGRHLRR